MTTCEFCGGLHEGMTTLCLDDLDPKIPVLPVIEIRCHAHLCVNSVVALAHEPDLRTLRSVARRNGWITVMENEHIWDFCPRHGMTDWRHE